MTDEQDIGLWPAAISARQARSRISVGAVFTIGILCFGVACGTPEPDERTDAGTTDEQTDGGGKDGKTDPTKPDAPTNVVAIAGDASASVSWTAPAKNGGEAITEYIVTPSSGAALSSTTTSIEFTGLANGTAYTFTVKAKNSVGLSAASAASNEIVPAEAGTLPDAPTNIVAVRGHQSATISWTAPANTGTEPIIGYVVTASGGATTNTTEASAWINGLTNGTKYTFTVKAQTAVGFSVESAPSNEIIPATLPQAPTNVVAVAGDASASMTWDPPADNGGEPIIGYTVRSSSGTMKTTTATSLEFTGLANGTTHTFTVQATNIIGSSVGVGTSNPVVPASPATVPDAPTGATLQSRGDGRLVILWTAPVNDGGSPITGYLVTPSIGLPQTVTSTLAEFTGLTNGTEYSFTIHAQNAIGQSVESAAFGPVAPARKPDAPTNVRVTYRGDGNAVVAWDAPANDGGAAISTYRVTPIEDGTPLWAAESFQRDEDKLFLPMYQLTNGKSYTFTVAASNVVGRSDESEPSEPSVFYSVPGAPTNVKAVAGDESATVSWDAPVKTGGKEIQAYIVTSNPAPTTGTTQSTTATSLEFTGLTNGTAYTFQVQAENDEGLSLKSVASSAVTPATPPNYDMALWPIPAGAPTDYTVANGMVTDNNTKLVWQQAVPTETYDWEGAKSYCASLPLGGLTGWRVPTRVELDSLVDPEQSEAPVIHWAAFPNTSPNGWFWSSTAYPVQPTSGWVLTFEQGKVDAKPKTQKHHVRCVSAPARADAPTERYTLTPDTVTDEETGLIWQREVPSGRHVWSAAVTYCSELNLAGQTDWRLPNRMELISLIDLREFPTSIDPTAFVNMPEYFSDLDLYFWTSSKYAALSNPRRWAVNFDYGSTQDEAESGAVRVRCVRSGN